MPRRRSRQRFPPSRRSISVAISELTVNRLAHALGDPTGHMDVDQFARASLLDSTFE